MLDFLLPLWVGSQLGASAAAVGALTALETLISFIVRPIAGSLADRYDRRRIEAIGAVLYGLSFTAGCSGSGRRPARWPRSCWRARNRRSLAMVASALFAAGLSFAPNPEVLTVMWILSAAAFAAAIPVEQAVVAEAAGSGPSFS